MSAIVANLLGLPHFVPLLAEVGRARHLARRVEVEDPSLNTTDLIWTAVLLGGPLVLMLLWKCVQRVRRDFQRRSRHALFLELCRAHGLGWRSCYRLWRLARRRGLNSPAMLFVCPQEFDEPPATAETPRSVGDVLPRLYRNLFDCLPERRR